MELSTRTKILSFAEHLIRTRGYADFSYADLVDTVGVKKASIHHHFPTKEDLGVEVVADYVERFNGVLEQILLRHKTLQARLTAYAELFAGALVDESFPLCTALAAELGALPVSMREQTVKFFELHLAWLRKVLSAGKEKGEIAIVDVEMAAVTLLSALEGGAVVAWALSRPQVVRVSFDAILAGWIRDN